MKNKKIWGWLLVILGILIILGTTTLFLFTQMPRWAVITLSIFNIISLIFILVGAIMKSISSYD